MSKANPVLIISKAEIFEKKRISYKRTVGVALRYYESFRLGFQPGLQMALNVVEEGIRTNGAGIWLLLLRTFFLIEAKDKDEAKGVLGIIKPYRNFYKNSEPLAYVLCIYLSALYQLNIDEKDIKRYIKQLNSFREKYNGYYLDLFISDLYFRSGDYLACLHDLEEAYTKGCRSFYMFSIYMDILDMNIYDKNGYIFPSFIKWVISQGKMEAGFLRGNATLIKRTFEKHVDDFLWIYNRTNSEILLALFCLKGIEENNMSEDMYNLYKVAGKKQLNLTGLDKMVVRLAASYGDSDVSMFFLQSFIEECADDLETMPFIYHLLLTDDKYDGLIEEFALKGRILQYGAYAFNNGKRDYIHNSIYKYLLKNIDDHQAFKDKIAAVIYEELFILDISFDEISQGSLCVYEREKQSAKFYEVNDGKVEIKSATGNIRLALIDKKNNYVEDLKYKVTKRLKCPDAALYEYYINKGYDDPNIYIALSALYISDKVVNEKYIDILNKTLNIPGISPGFRMQVDAASGNILSALSCHEKALEYFSKVDENRLDDDYIEIMLTAFINASDWEAAGKLIIKKREYISDRTLLWALKNMADQESMHDIIADPAYELIIKNWYDTTLLDIVIKNYAGSNKELFTLRESLNGISVSDISLDRKILENSLWIHDFSAEAQSVFYRLYKTEPEADIIKDYTYYSCYEILVNNVKPEYEVIALLEKTFANTSDKLIAYVLSKVYLRHNITTLASEEILIKTTIYMEEDGFLLPEFKSVKDKKLISPYIEKNQPFIYQASKDKEIVLYYKIGTNSEYEKIPMKHFYFGMFICVIPIFYNESITYFISEEMEKGSIRTGEEKLSNKTVNLKPGASDLYFQINNALIYEQMFKYDEAEKIITETISDGPRIRGKII